MSLRPSRKTAPRGRCGWSSVATASSPCMSRPSRATRRFTKAQDKQPLALEEFAEELSRVIRDAGGLVRCLTIELEIELGPGLAVVPVGEMFELAPPQRPLRERGASDGEAHTRCLPGDAALLRDRFGGSDNAARDQALPDLVLAREHENRVAFGDMLATIHRLLRGERECLRARIANLGFDRERHASPLPQ